VAPIYKRVLLKLSGEALAGDAKIGLEYPVVLNICRNIKRCVEMGVEMGVVVGGGNFWRGRAGGRMDRTRADHMGMLATVMNALALADALRNTGSCNPRSNCNLDAIHCGTVHQKPRSSPS
jgi:uridylate kinase